MACRAAVASCPEYYCVPSHFVYTQRVLGKALARVLCVKVQLYICQGCVKVQRCVKVVSRLCQGCVKVVSRCSVVSRSSVGA